MGGDIPSAQISATQGTGIDELKEKILKITHGFNLKQDVNGPARCFVIESNIDEKGAQVYASVLVQNGTLKVGDYFVCGQAEGKVKLMKNDKGESVKKALPGEAVQVQGFKHQPAAGHPLWVVKDPEVGKYIAHKIKQKEEKKKHMQHEAEDQKTFGDLHVGKMNWLEKRITVGGDKTIMYERLGIIER